MSGPSGIEVVLNPDYKDILFAFSAKKVEYLLVDAYALAVHGLPRVGISTSGFVAPQRTPNA